MIETHYRAAGRHPVITAVAVGIATVAGVLQYAVAGMIPLLERDPDALGRGELWRLISPLLVQTLGWYQLLPNLITLALFGWLVEWLLGRRWWFALFAAGTIGGQLAAYSWGIGGGGNSIAICGLAGGLLVFLLCRPVPPFAVLASVTYVAALTGWGSGGPLAALAGVVAVGVFWILRAMWNRPALDRIALACALAASAVLTFRQDLHGAALLAGAATASVGLAGKRGQNNYGRPCGRP